MKVYVIVGCGGTGSNLAPMLARMQKERDLMILVDGDTVTPGNIRRQTFQDFDIGQNKARSLSKKLNCCYGTKHYAVDSFLTSSEPLIDILKPIIDESDTYWSDKVYIIGCVDNNKARLILEESFKKLQKIVKSPEQLFYIDAGNEDTYGTVLISDSKNQNLRSEIFDMEEEPDVVHCDAEIAELNPQQYQINLDMALAIAKVVYAIDEDKKYPAVIKVNGFERGCIFAEEN